MRRRILASRGLLSVGEARYRADRIFQSFLRRSEELLPREYAQVALYYPVRGEVDTRSFFTHFLARSKRCLFPAMPGAGIEFHPVRDWAELQIRRFGIAEPVPAAGAGPSLPDVVLVPGVAFSRDGYRLGFGGGHYDRLIESWHQAGRRAKVRLIGLAYDFQLLEKIPVESHDHKLDAVVTETEVVFGGLP